MKRNLIQMQPQLEETDAATIAAIIERYSLILLNESGDIIKYTGPSPQRSCIFYTYKQIALKTQYWSRIQKNPTPTIDSAFLPSSQTIAASNGDTGSPGTTYRFAFPGLFDHA